MNYKRSKIDLPSFDPVDSAANLRERVKRLFRIQKKRRTTDVRQYSLDLPQQPSTDYDFNIPSSNVGKFLGFVADAVPDGDVYLFGGVLRDIALIGKKGFNSDVDLVVEGDWSHLISYLNQNNARKNKFGGYRLQIDKWPVDIWQAKETWAIKEGLVRYTSIESLTDTTILNWDAILMNWRTGDILHGENYFTDLRERILDVVLTENPNPLSAAVRAFRHLSLKEATTTRLTATKYLARCAKHYSIDQIHASELKSYGNSYIEPPLLEHFKNIDDSKEANVGHRFSIVREIVAPDLIDTQPHSPE